jgi:biopolymer transport protein TolR
MIDVMMSLLIIFMVVTPVLANYGAILPTARHAGPETLDDAVRIGIGRSGTLFIGQDSVSATEFPARVAALYEGRPGDHLAYLWADRELDYDRVLDVVAVLRAAGVRTLAAIADPVEARARDGGGDPGPRRVSAGR